MNTVYTSWTRSFSELGYERINFTRKDSVKTFSHYLRVSANVPVITLVVRRNHDTLSAEC